MKKIQWAAGIILAFSVIIILLISSFETAMYSDFGVYEREYEKYDVLDDLGMTMEDTMHVTREMMAYLRGDRDVLSVETTVEGRQQDFFNEQDRFHMAEVRDLFIGGLDLRLGACAAAVLCIIILIFLRADWRKIVPRSYWIVLAVIGVLLTVFAAAAVIDFNAVFVGFHHIFFDNDLWLFDPAEDYMIRMLPEGLFADMVVRIGVLFAGGMILLFILSLLPGILERKKIRKTYNKL
ncbi:MAG: TIGR01906 family membrane protein [Mediterraneibacter sp.]